MSPPPTDAQPESGVSGTHEPISPPTSPFSEDLEGLCSEDETMNPHAATVEDVEDNERIPSRGSSAASSPPTSADARGKKPDNPTNPLTSTRTSFSGLNELSDPNEVCEDETQFRIPSLTLSQLSRAGSEEDEDNFSYRNQHESPVDDPESQWESEGPSSPKQTRTTSTSHVRSRKSATPSSAKINSLPSRKSASSASKQYLQPQNTSRRTTQFYSSRASSASYNGAARGDRKAPLVLLHITLLFLPGAEEAILRKITPTMLERGLLVEHPRGDYQLLEELIIDSLGLDDVLSTGQENSEEEQDEWEKSLGVRRVQAKSQWELRVYAANGLMTSGAWRRVWGEMERVDVEVGPKGWRGKKTDDLIRGFIQNSGRSGEKDGVMFSRTKHAGLSLFSIPPTMGTKWWIGAIGISILLLVSSLGLLWTLSGKQWTNEAIQHPAVYSSGGDISTQILASDSVDTEASLPFIEPIDMLEVTTVVDQVPDINPACDEESSATADPVDEDNAVPAACVKTTNKQTGETNKAEEPQGEANESSEGNPTEESPGPQVEEETTFPLDTADEGAATNEEEKLAEADSSEPILLSFADDNDALSGDEEKSDPAGWWDNWKAGLIV